MASNFFKNAGDELADFVKWVKEVLQDEAIRKSIAEDLGLEPGQSLEKPKDQPLSTADNYRKQANPDKEAFINLLNDVRALYGNVRTCISGFGPTDITRVNSVLYLLFDMLAVNYARLYAPRVYFLVQALSAVVEDTSAMDENPYAIERFFTAIARAIEFLFNPVGYIYKSLASGIEDNVTAQKFSDRIFPPIAAFFAAMHPIADSRDVIYGWDSLIKPKKESCFSGESGSTTPRADAISERMLTLAFPISQDPTPTSDVSERVGVTLAVVPKTHADKPGLFIGVTGDGAVEFPVTERWKFLMQASAKPAFSLLLKSEDWDIDLSAGAPTSAPLNVALLTIPDETDVTFAIPKADDTGVEIGQLAFAFSFDGKKGGIQAQAQRCALVLAAKDQDGFINPFMPRDGLRVPFNFGAGFSTQKGFFTEGDVPWLSGHSSKTPAPVRPLGAAAAEVQEPPALSGARRPELGVQQIIPIGKSLLNVRINHLLLGLAPSADSGSPKPTAEISISITLKIGPVQAVVDRMGFEFGVGFPESGGNAGFADFSLGFRPPSGVGIVVDSPVVAGGGFLFFDPQKGLYAGVVQLSIQETLTVKAIGLIATRLPSGAKGFSFVVMITAEGFKPIPLGLGFTLTAIGGLLAINRTCNEDFLREAIKNKTLNDLLFPKNPIVNAPQIFSSLANAFPARDGSYLFGPIVQICWGTPPVLTMDLAVIVEVGQRNRVVILGRVSAILPSEKHDLIRLNMNTLGVLDFDQNSIALDAVLYDSRFANKFPVTGTMILRLNWGSSPNFALAIGGFHPAFKPPANFPVQQRIAISLADDDDFRLRIEGYLAITSNTVQFGAHTEMLAKAHGFTVEGRVGFDVLVQFDPFAFLAAFHASVQIKRGSHNLLKVQVNGELGGPRPLFIKCKVHFEIFWIDISIPINKTLISGERPPALESVVVMAQLKTALNDQRNWTGQLPSGERRAVTLREIRGAEQIPLHPLGQLSVKQNVVPLGLEIAKFGNAKPAGERLFNVTQFRIGVNTASFQPEKDFFAPAQFLELSDDEKLQAPSFESMPAGISVARQTFVFTSNTDDLVDDDAAKFETIILDKTAGEPRQAPDHSISTDQMDRLVALGAAAQSVLRRSGTARYRVPISKNAPVKKGWTIVSAVDGSPQDAPGFQRGEVATYSESFNALQAVKRSNPTRARDLMLVRVKANDGA